MSLSAIDFISPKITLYYNGRKSHVSNIGGFFSVCLLVAIILFIFYIIWDVLVDPKIISSLIYEHYLNKKIVQPLNYKGINHFIQLYSQKDDEWLENYDKKSIIIYSIKGNQTISRENPQNNLDNIEHWLYDKCEKIYGINDNLFSKISNKIPNYKNSICLRYYYNINTKEYYEIGFDGFVTPNLETNKIFEKKDIYKIIVEKCNNYSFIINKFGYSCNNEDDINNYLEKYSEIFTYFSDNQVMPINFNSPLEKYFYSISSVIDKNFFFQNNIIFSPIKLMTGSSLLRKSNKEEISHILRNHYSNNIANNANSKIIGVFNFYLDNKIIIYQRKYNNLLDAIAHLGGALKILYFIFQIINYYNYEYTSLEHTRDLFYITTGIDFNPNASEQKESFLEKRHMTNHNYKIKVFNNNNIINTEEVNNKINKNYYHTRTEKKKSNKGYFDKKTSTKKNFLFQLNKNRDTFLSKRSQTKYINNVNEMPMGKQLGIRSRDKKRKSYLSQGYFLPKNENSMISKNQTIYDNDLSNNEIISNNDRNYMIHFKEGTLKCDSPHRTSHETNLLKAKGKTKTRKFAKKSFLAPTENITDLLTKNLDYYNNGRHKSVNFTNQRRMLENNNSLNTRQGIFGKNSSGFIDSSKQILVNNSKGPLMLFNNKIKFENNYDNYSRIPTLINNNDFFNNTMANIPNNSNDVNAILKNLIHNKIKFLIPENKKKTNILGTPEKKIIFFDFLKSLLVYKRKNENKICLLNSFRTKLLSEEHIYRIFINLYLILKVFQMEETHKFEINELYNNL